MEFQSVALEVVRQEYRQRADLYFQQVLRTNPTRLDYPAAKVDLYQPQKNFCQRAVYLSGIFF